MKDRKQKLLPMISVNIRNNISNNNFHREHHGRITIINRIHNNNSNSNNKCSIKAVLAFGEGEIIILGIIQ